MPLLNRLQRRATHGRHRYTIVFSGSQPWATAQSQALIRGFAFADILWVGSDTTEGYTHRHPGRAHTVLGGEYNIVVQDAHEGFDVDDFGALSGVVRAGGFFIILAPKFSQWVSQADPAMDKILVAGYEHEPPGHRFISRLCHLLRQDQGVVILREGGESTIDSIPMQETPAVRASSEAFGRCASQDQANAVAAISGMLSCETDSAVVLISDRGRGKSSALGIAAADLIRKEGLELLITAPRLSAVSTVFERAFEALPGAEQGSGCLQTDEGGLRFYAPDELVRQSVKGDLLLVDEAAAIPVPLLSRLLDHYSKVVFATTVHGYEGSGRGFELRFSRVLDQKRPMWKKIRLNRPIRWADHDPLEALSFRALLLDAGLVRANELKGFKLQDCLCERMDRDLLVQDESTLNELFGLLVTAHYRTRPFDLRYLLDAPNVTIYVLRWGAHVVATTMLSEEGGFDATTSLAIYAGLRRPRGHLLAQSLSAHVGVESAARLNFMRVVRIAVHPELQDRGLGTYLLQGIIRDQQGRGIDAIGASFAADTKILNFWRQNDFHAVHVGMTQEHTSGSHSVMMLRPLSAAGQEAFAEARQRFSVRFALLLKDVLAKLDQPLRDALIADLPSVKARPDAQHELLAYAFARRGFEVSLYAIWQWVQDYLDRSSLNHLNSQQLKLLRLRVLDHVGWKDVVSSLNLSGKREAQKLMRETVAQMIEQTGNEAMLEYRNTLKRLIE